MFFWFNCVLGYPLVWRAELALLSMDDKWYFPCWSTTACFVCFVCECKKIHSTYTLCATKLGSRTVLGDASEC